MIRCHYTPETLEKVAKEGKQSVLKHGAIWHGLILLILIVGITIYDVRVFNMPYIKFIIVLLVLAIGFSFVTRRCDANITRTALENTEAIITLDEEYVQHNKTDGTNIMLPRQGLKAICRYGTPEHKMFDIWNPEFDPNLKITLTSGMENAKELVNAITPGAWSDD